MTVKTKENKVEIHLISDSTGETVSRALEAVISQFPQVNKKVYQWNLVKYNKEIENILKNVKEQKSIVIYTLLNNNLRNKLEEGCISQKIPFISLLDPLFKIFNDLLSINPTKNTGGQHKLDKEYFSRIDALDYTMRHDDGQNILSMKEADIILVGVSRTSKTPTSIYLANKGYKVGNLPIVLNTIIPKEFFEIKGPLIIGLLNDPKNLLQIRQSRLKSMGETTSTNYSDLDKIKIEILESRRLFLNKKWPTIDVSKRSVEETATEVIQILRK